MGQPGVAHRFLIQLADCATVATGKGRCNCSFRPRHIGAHMRRQFTLQRADPIRIRRSWLDELGLSQNRTRTRQTHKPGRTCKVVPARHHRRCRRHQTRAQANNRPFHEGVRRVFFVQIDPNLARLPGFGITHGQYQPDPFPCRLILSVQDCPIELDNARIVKRLGPNHGRTRPDHAYAQCKGNTHTNACHAKTDSLFLRRPMPARQGEKYSAADRRTPLPRGTENKPGSSPRGQRHRQPRCAFEAGILQYGLEPVAYTGQAPAPLPRPVLQCSMARPGSPA